MKTTHLIILTKCDLMCFFSLSLGAIGKNSGGGLDRILSQPNFTSLVVDPLKVCNSKICHMGMDVYRFIYAFMAGGIFTLLVTCTGHVAAETSNSFCLSCYTVIQIVLLLVQFAIAGVLFFDSHWHEVNPNNSA
jgi:hypothetical protein